ncbi:hypothetical protein ABTK11_21235, partial [Acinetobacter baumannii]
SGFEDLREADESRAADDSFNTSTSVTGVKGGGSFPLPPDAGQASPAFDSEQLGRESLWYYLRDVGRVARISAAQEITLGKNIQL